MICWGDVNVGEGGREVGGRGEGRRGGKEGREGGRREGGRMGGVREGDIINLFAYVFSTRLYHLLG